MPKRVRMPYRVKAIKTLTLNGLNSTAEHVTILLAETATFGWDCYNSLFFVTLIILNWCQIGGHTSQTLWNWHVLHHVIFSTNVIRGALFLVEVFFLWGGLATLHPPSGDTYSSWLSGPMLSFFGWYIWPNRNWNTSGWGKLNDHSPIWIKVIDGYIQMEDSYTLCTSI